VSGRDEFAELQAMLREARHERNLPPMAFTEPQPCPTRRARIVTRTVVIMVLAGFGLWLGFGCAAHGAEPVREFEVWAARSSGRLLAEDRPNWVKIQAIGTFTSKVECVETIKGVRLEPHLGGQSGWRLVCLRVEDRR